MKFDLKANNTILEFGDASVDISPKIFFKMAASAVFLAEMVACWKLHSLIIRYLKNKPLGNQSLLDAFHKIMFRSSQGFILTGSIQIIMERIFIDTGDVVAKIWMWAIYDCTTALGIVTGLNPIVQLLLVKNPSHELPLSDKWMERLTLGFVWLPILIMNAVCTVLGFYPPSYDMLRGQEVHHPGFGIIRLIIFALSALAFGSIRLIIHLTKGSNREQSRHLLSEKVTWMAAILFIFITLAVVFGLQNYLVEILGFFYVLLNFTIIATNARLLENFKSDFPWIYQTIFKIRFIRNRSIQPLEDIDLIELRIES